MLRHCPENYGKVERTKDVVIFSDVLGFQMFSRCFPTAETGPLIMIIRLVRVSNRSQEILSL